MRTQHRLSIPATRVCRSLPNRAVTSVLFVFVAVLVLATAHVGAGDSCYSPPTAPAGFDDIAHLSEKAKAGISTAASAGMMTGCGGTFFCPEEKVTRQDMAVYLLRFMEYSTYTPPTAAGCPSNPTFNDMPCSNCMNCWVEEFAARGITAGCGGGSYCPLKELSRAEMAIFVIKSIYGGSHTPPDCTTDPFNDVPCSHWAAKHIAQLKCLNVTAGCGGGNYCPDNQITNWEMAVFLANADALTPAQVAACN